ncbi:MAG: hypothetical protein NC395_10215 [Prevotella sp.]|nr:hypothetical protein [Prevotella sp.]
MIYADFQYYKDFFKGKLIPAEDFDHAAIPATQYINNVTFGRIGSNVTDAVKNACCAAAEIYYRCDMSEAALEAAGKSSEKTGDHSVTYAKSDFSYSSKDKQLSKAVRLWLGSTGLLYRGFG